MKWLINCRDWLWCALNLEMWNNIVSCLCNGAWCNSYFDSILSNIYLLRFPRVKKENDDLWPPGLMGRSSRGAARPTWSCTWASAWSVSLSSSGASVSSSCCRSASDSSSPSSASGTRASRPWSWSWSGPASWAAASSSPSSASSSARCRPAARDV